MAAESTFDPNSLAGLDEPVQRYLRHAVKEGTLLFKAWAVEMKGTIRAGVKLPFSARQVLDGREFIWKAKVPSFRLGLLEVTDFYQDGMGGMTGRLLGRKVFTDTSSDAARSAATRAVMESTMVPATLLTGDGVQWEVISEREIRFQRADTPRAEQVTIRIDLDGRPVEVEAPRWFKEKERPGELVPFICRFSGEKLLAGMNVPAEMVAGWQREEFEPYFRARIMSVEPSSGLR